jgi:hypothetical protein
MQELTSYRFPGVDEPDKNNILELKEIFEGFSVPSVFLEERVVGVTNSFGIRDANHNTQGKNHLTCCCVFLTGARFMVAFPVQKHCVKSHC